MTVGQSSRARGPKTKLQRAKNLLRTREADIARGLPLSSKVGRLRFEEAADDIRHDYKMHERASFAHLERRITLHLEPAFGGRRLAAMGDGT